MKKKKRLELLGGAAEEESQDQYVSQLISSFLCQSASNFDVSEPKEKIPAIKEID